MKSYAGTAIKEVISSDKKLKQAAEWLALMRKWMIEAREEIKVTDDARVEIMNLQENFRVEVADLRKNFLAWIRWLWNELWSLREENMWLLDELQQACSKIC